MPTIRTLLLLLLLVLFNRSLSQSRVIDSLQKIIDDGRNDTEHNKALNAIATEYTRTDMAKAKAFLYRSIYLAEQLKNPVLLSYAYSQMVSVQNNTGKKDSAQYYLQLLKNLAATNVPDNVKANYNLAAGLFYKKQGNYKAALPFMINSLNDYIAADKKNSQVGLRTSIAGQYLNIGNTYMDMGEYKNALQYHLQGLKIFEEIDNKRGISFCNQSISSDFLNLGQYNEALPYNAKSLALKKELNDKRGVVISTAQYGSIYKGLGDYEKAIAYFNEALQSFHELKLVPDEAKTDVELGKVYVLKKETQKASKYFETAKTIAQQLKDSTLLIAVDAEKIAMQTTISLQKNDEQKLMTNLQTSIEMQDKNKEISSYQYLADYYANKKEFDKALEYTNKLHQMADSVQGKDLQVEIKKLEEQYNFEKKEKEIALLKKDQQLSVANLQREKSFQYGVIIFLAMAILIGFLVVNRYRVMQRAGRLIEMERMRNNIARDLHDDIGSTLTSINILSKVALQQEENGDTMMGANMQKIKDRSSAIMESMSDIVWAINPQNDTFEQMIFRMKEFTAEILEPLNINYTFKETGNFSAIKLDIKKRKDFYLLFKEAINNAAKYSCCKNLTVQIEQDADSLHLKITDDGTGFNEKVVKTGNGLINMRERAAAMGGEININSEAGKGTNIKLVVPIT
ncbi:tetratricopeptide repeat-containing sensor histidine kinase [Ferruginibacter sp. SUN106]|uniref:tetratricopeptide repeat-containing sensor histidine kinase n=1 Tax=Ferruginibacter sp. SUN106 TaxID=2978348 RepID=UPI003D364AA8